MRESSQALAAFVLYRDMGPDRTVAKVATECHRSVSLLNHWSQAHHWQDRIRGHEQAIAEKTAKASQAERVNEAARRRKERLRTADTLRDITGKVMVRWAKKKTLPELIVRPSAVMRMVEYVDKTERLDTGEPTERIDVTELSTEDLLEQIARLQRFDQPTE